MDSFLRKPAAFGANGHVGLLLPRSKSKRHWRACSFVREVIAKTGENFTPGNHMRFAGLLLVYALVACSDETRHDVSTAISPVTACAERGTAYFRRIRSYPTLHSAPNIGRLAETVALERCELDLTAF